MWFYIVLGIFILAGIFAVFYTKDFIKYNPKYDILLQGMEITQIYKFIFIYSFVAGFIFSPFMLLWLVSNLFKKRGNLYE